MRPLKYTAGPADEGLPVRHVLTEVFQMSSSHISRLKRRPGGILLNGEPCYVTAGLREGDVVEALICDPPDTKTLEPMEAPLDVVYEDEWLIVLNKAAGISVHPERSGIGGSLENALTARLAPGEFVHTVSRLDRWTSGLMTVAKSGYMHERMIRLLHTPDFIKEYRAVCEGVPQPGAGFIRLPIGHPEGENYRMQVRADGLPSLTEYEVLYSHGGRSFLRLLPHTGRMHQLRVHMAAGGCPLTGDWLYGTEIPEMPGPALHSYRLEFLHPMTGERKELFAPVPECFEKLLNAPQNIWNPTAPKCVI
ncbi:MAG: RluA family pseudouridine synthase [Clostridia bacterium]|nr:RluA family pseudouridine synthase [Clostridia bacterium]